MPHNIPIEAINYKNVLTLLFISVFDVFDVFSDQLYDTGPRRIPVASCYQFSLETQIAIN